MNAVDRILREHAGALRLASYGLGEGWGTVLLTPRFVTSRHVVALVFAPGRSEPSLIAKVPRQPGDNSGVLREAAVLEQLSVLTGTGTLGVPEIVGVIADGVDTVLIETAVTGAPLDPESVGRDLAGAITAGARFVETLPITRPAADNCGWYERAISTPLRALVNLVAGHDEITELCDRTHELLSPLAAAPLPAVFEHADLSHPNLFLGPDGDLRVVDWERASAAGLPGHDLIFFLQYLGESAGSAYTRPRQVEAFARAFGERGWAREVVTTHLRHRGVDPDLFPLLVIATWARSTATLADRLTQLGAPVADRGRAAAAAVAQDRDFWLWRHAVRAASGGPA